MFSVLKKIAGRKGNIRIDSDNLEELIILDQETLERLQGVLLDMYKDISKVCRKYGIVPYLVGGSALGAYRHHGFIPWDDDLDIGMTRKDYTLFREIFARELGENYILNAPNYSRDPKARFPKILKKGTICRGIDDSSEDRICGIFIDIFIIENIPDQIIIRTAKGLCCNIMEFIGGQVALKQNKESFRKILVAQEGKAVSLVRNCVGTVFGFAGTSVWYHGIDKVVRYNHETNLVGLPTGRKHYFREVLPADVIGPPRYIPFCDIEAPVFHKVESYLQNLYGETYMQVPQENKREKHYLIDLKF